MKIVPKHFSLFLLLTFCTLVIDLCLFFLTDGQTIPLTLGLFACHLFPLASVPRLLTLSVAICLQAFTCLSNAITPLVYLVPALLIARYANGKIYEGLIPPSLATAACFAGHIWLLQPHLLDSTQGMTCTFSSIIGIIGGAWMVSLTLRKQGGRGNRPRP